MKNILLTPALVAILGLALAGTPITAQAQTTNDAPDTTAPDATAPGTPDTTAPSSDSSSDTTPPAKGGKKKSGKSDKSAKTPFKGSITAIDASSVTVASSDKTLTLAITPKTKFKVDTTAGSASDFAVGDKVTGSYSGDSSGGMTANLLHKKGAGGGKGKKSGGDSSGGSSTSSGE